MLMLRAAGAVALRGGRGACSRVLPRAQVHGLRATSTSAKPRAATAMAAAGGPAPAATMAGATTDALAAVLPLRPLWRLWQRAANVVKAPDFHMTPFMVNPRVVCGVRVGSLSDWCGHISFSLLAVSYFLDDMLPLRVVAIGGISWAMLFQYFRPIPLYLPISWNALFLLINIGWVVKLLMEHSDAERVLAESKDAEQIYRSVFQNTGITAVEFMWLLKAAKPITFEPGACILAHGQAHDVIYLVQNGQARVSRAGENLGTINRNSFVGEMNFLSFCERDDDAAVEDVKLVATADVWATTDATRITMGPLAEDTSSQRACGDTTSSLCATSCSSNHITNSASSNNHDNNNNDDISSTTMSASTTTQQTAAGGEVCGGNGSSNAKEDHTLRMYVWRFQDLRKLLKKHPAIAKAFNTAVSNDLRRKLQDTWNPHYRYNTLVESALLEGSISDKERARLTRFREKHAICQHEHERVLKRYGWSVSQFERGTQEPASNQSASN